MKTECGKERLAWALTVAEKITGKNLSLPALSCVLLETEKNFLNISATNLDLGVKLSIPAKTEKIGSLLVTGSVLVNLLTNLYKDDKVKLEAVNNTLAVSSLNNSSILKTYPRDDFPNLPQLSGGQTFSFSMPTELLVGGLRAVSYAAALSDIKPEIASVYLSESDKQLLFVSTDSFRLAEKKIIQEPISAPGFKLIIPIRNAAEIVRVFERAPEAVEVNYDHHQLALVAPGVYLISRLVEGVFPDYQQIMPMSFKTGMVVLRTELQNALKISNVFSDKFNQVSLKIMPKERICEIVSQNSEVGENVAKLEAALEGEELEISFNAKYLLDCFSALTTDSVSIQFNGRNRPLVVSGVGDGTFRYLIMPLNR